MNECREIVLPRCEFGHVISRTGICLWCKAEGVEKMTPDELLIKRIDAFPSNMMEVAA